MKTIYYFLIAALTVTSCKKRVNNEITVIGHLKDTDIKEVSLTSDDLTFKAPVDSNGTFTLKFICNQPRVYQLRFKDKLDLFLIPSDIVIINKDGEDYQFSGGQSAVLCKYYLNWGKYRKKLSFRGNKKCYSLEPNDYTEKAYAYLDSTQIPLNKLIKKLKNINPVFLRLEKERLKYDMFGYLQAYGYGMHKYHTGQEPTINESFHNYMNDVNLNDSSLMQLEDYKDFLTGYIYYTSKKNYQSNTDISKDKYAWTNIMLNSISHEFKNQKILDYVIHNLIFEQTKLLQVNDKNLITFKKLCKNQDYIKEVENKYHELQVLRPGIPAPDFILYDANNKEYKLSDFKGKYLFIDVWGIYCGPCIKEISYFKQIEHDYKGKNIEFISTCFENNRELWLKKIKEFNLEGIQLIVKGSWNSKFSKDYQIPWVPTYILIDKEGKIIDARAPKPSENLRDLLNKTLETEIWSIK